MAAFVVEFSPAAVRDLKHLDPPVRQQLLKICGVLADNPSPQPGGRIKLLVGVIPAHYRLRVGDYRIVFRIEKAHVIVVRVAHRREAYR